MIPREAKRGNSFKGAGLYYLHDKGALTDERVAFTHVENLPTDDPELATRWMAYTALNADELKRQAGVAQTGKKASKPVFCFSLSWHPEEQPDQAHMIETGRSALAAIGLQEHQAVMVAHRDEAYSHLHCIVNLVNPNHGKTHTLQYSRRRLSTWAENYERTHSQQIYCEQRVKNNQRRKEGEYVKYQDPELDQKAIITKLYQSADNGKALQAALTEAGYTLAQGKRIVLLDQQGKIHNLARQIEGVREKEVRALLKGLALPDVDDARKQQEEERSKQSPPQQAEREDDKQRDDQDGRQPDIQTHADAGAHEAAQKERPSTFLSAIRNRLQNRQRDELLHFSWEEASAARSQLWRSLERQYGEMERRLQGEIDNLTRTLKERGRLPQEAAARLTALRHDLAQIEARKSAATQSLDSQLRVREEAIKARHAREWEGLQRGITPPKTELAQKFEQPARAPQIPQPIPPPEPARQSGDHHAPAPPVTQTTPERTAEDRERDAFLDRLEGRRHSPARERVNADAMRRELTPEFGVAAQTHTSEESELYSFLDRLEGDGQELILTPPQAPQIKDEYAHSLSAEFDAAGGVQASEDAALDAFLSRMEGDAIEQGISMDMD